MISRELEITLNHAVNEAKQRGHEFVTLEHILYALLHNSKAEKAIRACGGSSHDLKESILDFFQDKFDSSQDSSMMPKPTVAFQRVLQRAARHVMNSGKDTIEAESLLMAMFAEKDSFARHFMEKQGISRFDLMRWIAHRIPKDNLDPEMLASLGPDAMDDDDGLDSFFHEDQEDSYFDTTENLFSVSHDQPEKSDDSEKTYLRENRNLSQEARRAYRALRKDKPRQKSGTTSKTKLLDKFATDLCARAIKGMIDPVIGREAELDRTVQILCRRQKNNPLFVGDAGVGKTALAEGLAHRIVSNMVPTNLKGSRIYSLDLGLVIAGSKYRGDFEERLRGITKEIQESSDIILFIDEIHTLMGTGSVSGGTMDASNLLKPALGSGKIRCIGATTFKEYRKYFEADHAMSRRFQKIDIDEPSKKDTLQILFGLKDRFEKFHKVRYSQASLQAAVDLSSKYIHHKKLPDKAIDVLDEVGASFALKRSKTSDKIKLAGVMDVKRVVAQLAAIPEKSLKASDFEQLKNLGRQLSSVVFGQDHAVAAVETTVKLAKTGLGDNNRPQGVFFFAGPTGVGKTELSIQLARTLGVPLHRFDMSEYMERHAVSRLVGAPPGYVGYDDGGLLTEKVKQKPHSVLLFDEIEKAHRDVHNILLQVMDRGVLTDSNGRETDFRGTIIIMTSNVGAHEMSQWQIGFDNHIGGKYSAQKALKKSFSPEFLGRIDHIITFKSLPPAIATKIVETHLSELVVRLKTKGYRLSYDNNIIPCLVDKGFDAIYGARPLKSHIQDVIKKPLSQLILESNPRSGSMIHIRFKASKKSENGKKHHSPFSFDLTPPTPKPAPKKSAALAKKGAKKIPKVTLVTKEPAKKPKKAKISEKELL